MTSEPDFTKLTRPRVTISEALERTNRVTRRAKILSLDVSAGSFDLKRTADAEDRPMKLTVKPTASWSAEAMVTVVRFEVRSGTPVQASDILKVDATYTVLYEIDGMEDIDKSDLACFAWINSTLNAWPYWREFVGSATTRLGLPNLTIPLLTPQRAASHVGFKPSRKKS